jgi:hypothetical protein
MTETNIFDMSSFEKLKTTHDGHGRVSCETRTELEKYFDLEVVNKIVNKLYYEDFVDLSYDEFMEVVNDLLPT